MVSSATVANRLLELADYQLTPMQVLKLVFLSQAWMLGLHGKALIGDRIEAWKYGPVIPDLYHTVKRYRGGPITKPLRAARSERMSTEERELVDEVFRVYGDWTGPELSHLTHKPGSPWDQVFEDGGWGQVIPTGVIRDYYERQAEHNATA
jgi:uncharacterized phage-associated protein